MICIGSFTLVLQTPGLSVVSPSRTSTLPESGAFTPVVSHTVVVLPEPLGLMKPTIEPLSISRFRSNSPAPPP